MVRVHFQKRDTSVHLMINKMDEYLHTDYTQQRRMIEEIESNITLESVRSHFAQKLEIKVLSMEKLSTNGVINLLYLLETSKQKLILRVSNPHPFWKSIKTANEVTVLKMVRDNTNIPVPVVIDFNIDQSKSSLHCQYILFQYIENDGTLDEYISSIKEDPDFINKAKLIIKDGINVVKQLSEIKLNNQYIAATNLEKSPAPIRWDGPPIGPFKSMSAMISEGLRVSIVHLSRIQCEQIRSQFPIQSIIESLRSIIQELSSREIDNSRFVWRHGDLHPGNISVRNGRFNGVYDWETARTGLLEQRSAQYHLEEWFDDLDLSQQVREQLMSYQQQLISNANFPISSEWVSNKKYHEIMHYSFWSWFYSVTWWRQNSEEQLAGCARQEQRTNLAELVRGLKEYGYL